MGKYNVITVSREFGSGGRFIGEAVAKKLGIDYYDAAIIEKVVEETGLAKECVERVGEYAPSKSIFAYSFIGREQSGYSIEDHILAAQDKVVHDLAAKGPCVIIGRSADYSLKERNDCLHVFIEGNKPEKIKRITRLYKVTEDEAAKMLKDVDKKRSLNYQYWTSHKWGARENYDMILNSSTLGYDAVIDILVDIYKQG